MSSNLPRRALISISSFNGAIYPGNRKTGLFYTEALHPFEVLTAAGFEVDLASETGTFGMDEVSITSPFLSGSDSAILKNPNHPFNVQLNTRLRKAADLKKEDYGLFYASAGHSALYDYPTAVGLQAIASSIWNRGGIVATVCHGPAILPGVVDAKTNRSVVEGRTVTGFAVEGELMLGTFDIFKRDHVVLVADAVTNAGGHYSSPMSAFDDYSVTSGRLVTGTNPASARSAAERAVKAFDSPVSL